MAGSLLSTTGCWESLYGRTDDYADGAADDNDARKVIELSNSCRVAHKANEEVKLNRAKLLHTYIHTHMHMFGHTY